MVFPIHPVAAYTNPGKSLQEDNKLQGRLEEALKSLQNVSLKENEMDLVQAQKDDWELDHYKPMDLAEAQQFMELFSAKKPEPSIFD